MKALKEEIRCLSDRLKRIESMAGLTGVAYVEFVNRTRRLRELAQAVVDSVADAKPRQRRRSVDAEALIGLAFYLDSVPPFEPRKAKKKRGKPRPEAP